MIHDPENVLFAWTQGEEEGAAIDYKIIVSNAQGAGIEFDSSERITCITPAGKPYTLPPNIKSLDFTSDGEDYPDGALLNFTTTDGKTFVSVFRPSNKEFLGYAELINSNTNDNKEKIRYKSDAKKIPNCRADNTTKTLTEQSRVLLGKKIDCAINVYQIEYSDVANKKGVSEESYCGSGTYSSEPLPYNVEGKTPITVGDNTACLNQYAKKFYEGHKNASSAYRDALLRIANLINSIEEQGDNVFSDYEQYCRKRESNKYYGNPETWPPDYYDFFAKALKAYINNRENLENLILSEPNRERMTDLAFLLVSKYSKSISYKLKIHILRRLSEAKMWGNPLFGNGEAYLALQIIDLITEDEASDFIKDLQSDNLMQNLCANINNFGIGGDNYTKFIAKLTSMFYNINIDEFSEVYADVEGYYYDRRNKEKNLELWFTWRKSFRNDKFNIRYSYEYTDNKLIFTTNTGHWIDFNPSWTRPPIDPFDIVIVTFDDVPEHICDNCLAKGEVVAMPAFLFEWICNEFTNQQVVDYIDKSITFSSLFLAGAGTAVTKGARVLKVINAVVAAGNVALLNDDFKDFITLYLSNEALDAWNTLSFVLDVGNPLSSIRASNALEAYNSFVVSWDLFKNSSEYKKLMDGEKAIMLKQADALLMQIKHEIEY